MPGISGKYLMVALAALILFLGSFALTGQFASDAGQGDRTVGEIKTFRYFDGEACTEDGKPVIYLFSTTWCPHCRWIKSTFDSVVSEYVSEGKIVAHHWELDTKDDTLTIGTEGVIPAEDMAVYTRFNPRGSIPTFVFGCKYYRIGNGYEKQGRLDLEAAEFRAVIEKLLSES